MTNPLDSSDLASLIQADWHEEFGDIDYANEIRESVLQPSLNNWHWSDDIVGGNGIGGDHVGIDIGADRGVGGFTSVGGKIGGYVGGDDDVGGIEGADDGGVGGIGIH